MPTKEKAQQLTQLEAPKKLNLAGYSYVGDLLQQLLNELIEPNQSETTGAAPGATNPPGRELHTGE